MARTDYDEAARERSRRFECARRTAMALCAGLNVDDLPLTDIVSAHDALRIKAGLRREGHDVG